MRCSLSLTLLLVGGCTPASIHVHAEPAAALRAAAKRLVERGIDLDPAGATATRLRTRHYCYKAPDRAGGGWDRSFARPAPGPVPFTHEGDLDEQARVAQTCERRFRVELTATPEGDGARLVALAEWWRLRPGRCAPQGDPLLGRLRCDYRYAGSRAPASVERFIYGLLGGL